MSLYRYSGRRKQEDDLVGLVSTSLCMLVCLGGYDENLELIIDLEQLN